MIGRRSSEATKAELAFDWLIAGLGNPGVRYENTRHNVGVMALEMLADDMGQRLRPGRGELLEAYGRIGAERVLAMFPTTFMNESGRSVARGWRRTGQDGLQHLVVLHDELDLEPGVVRVKVGGGLAGHNGLRSIAQHLSSQDFVRVRIGIGKPPGGAKQGTGHVLTPLRGPALEDLKISARRAADAAAAVVSQGPDAAMAEFNRS